MTFWYSRFRSVSLSFFLLSILLAPFGAGALGAVCPETGCAEEFSIIVLPDTQFYSRSYPQTFLAQTQWIKDNLEREKIVFVTQEGDIIHNGAEGEDRNLVQWQRASTAMSLLHNVVPYSVAPGNHDYDTVGDRSSTTRFTEFFGPQRYASQPWYGGASENGLNHFQTFSAGKWKFLHLALEWEAPDVALAWAQSVIDSHPLLPTIITTHSYIWDEPGKEGRTQSAQTSGGNSGEDIFQKLVTNNPQIFMVLNGHWHKAKDDDGEHFQVSLNSINQPVFEMQADYQDRPNGGDGWLRILNFNSRKNELRVSTYSPVLDKFQDDDKSSFTIQMSFNRRFNYCGRVEGIEACIEEWNRFVDVPLDAWYAPSIWHMSAEEIITGYKDSKGNPLRLFKPSNSITYAELAKMSLLSAGKDIFPDSAPVKNISARNHWASPYISAAEQLSLTVFTASLDINTLATRGDVIETILDSFDVLPDGVPPPYTDVPLTHPRASAIATATKLGLVHGDTNSEGQILNRFRPDDPITRAEVAKMLSATMKLRLKNLQLQPGQ